MVEVRYIETLTVEKRTLHLLAAEGYISGDDDSGWLWTAEGTRWINERLRVSLSGSV